jgi:hypothetical protein
MLALNANNTIYTKHGFPQAHVTIAPDAVRQRVGEPYADKDDKTYWEFFLHGDAYKDVPEGWYLADDSGLLVYAKDIPIKRNLKKTDFGDPAPEKFKAPQPELFSIIIKGILRGELEWGLVITGVLIAVVMELMGISALPVAVGMYLGLSTAMPIFFGGLLRWLTDRWRGVSASEAETETSPGVLMSSGYIAGGTLCGLMIGFLVMFVPKAAMQLLDLGQYLGESYNQEGAVEGKIAALVMFFILAAILVVVGSRKDSVGEAR